MNIIKIIELIHITYDKIKDKSNSGQMFYVSLFLMIMRLGFIYESDLSLLALETYTNDLTLMVEIVGFIIILAFFVLKKPKKEIVKVKKKKGLVVKTIEYSNHINRDLELIRSKIKSDYVSISLFHNGTVTFNRIHLLKMSRLFEAYAINKTSRIDARITHSITLLPYYNSMLNLINKGYLYIPDAKKYENKTLSDTLIHYNTMSALYVPIYSSEFIGFLCFEWDKKTNFTQQEVDSMINEYKSISHYFTENLE